jgi:hypothetical protein
MKRAFMFPVYVLIDEDEAVAEEHREVDAGPVTFEEVKEYLRDAIRIHWDDETYGNPIGVLSVNVHTSETVELSDDEKIRLFGK